MRTPEEVAREALEQVRGPMLSIFKGAEHDEWQDVLSVLVDQEAEFVADLIRARDAEVRADERAKVLAGFEWEHRTDLPGRRGINPVRRLVGPWEPTP